jgi:hypothetical protein
MSSPPSTEIGAQWEWNGKRNEVAYGTLRRIAFLSCNLFGKVPPRPFAPSLRVSIPKSDPPLGGRGGGRRLCPVAEAYALSQLSQHPFLSLFSSVQMAAR